METHILRQQVIHIADELKISHGDDYSNEVCKAYFELLDTYPADKINTLQIIIDAFCDTIDYDNKDKVIASLQKKMKELETTIKNQDAKISKLEEENKTLKNEIKELKNEITELKTENQNLNKKVNMLMRNHNIVILAESIKTIQYYIIQRATGFDDARMKDVNLNLDEFINNPLYTQYKLEIEKLQEHFEISKYQSVINKIINKRNRLSHPNPIEMDELKQACDDMKTVYSGIDAIYNHYQEVYDYFNC